MLTDVVLVGMTGPELAARIKAARPSIEVIFMSGYTEPTVADRRILELAGSYLPKPFSPDALAAKVREVLGPIRPASVILVVDDEPEIRDFLRKVLTDASYKVLEAANGREAVRQVETSSIDLVIMDLAMPEQEGIETIQVLRRVRPQLKVIAVSGSFAGLLVNVAEPLGAVASLAKPIQPDELLAAVSRAMAAGEKLG
jgi:CheY-like chemotaxis protein